MLQGTCVSEKGAVCGMKMSKRDGRKEALGKRKRGRDVWKMERPEGEGERGVG